MQILWIAVLILWFVILIARIALQAMEDKPNNMIPKRVMYMGGYWGNAIYYANDEHKRIYGFKNRLFNSFAEGSVLFDICHYKYEDFIPLYIITNIQYEEDPGDMFHADITFLGNIKNPKPQGDYDVAWYKPYIRELLAKYKKTLKELPRFAGKERKFNKMIINVLELMNA